MEEKQIINKEKTNALNKLVFCGDNSILNMLTMVEEQQVIWEHIVNYLVKIKDIKGINQEQFRNSLFYRLNVFTREELGYPLIPKNGLYEFNPGRQYSLVFAVYHPHYLNFDSNDLKENTVDFSDELLNHVGLKTFNLPAHQKKYTKYFDFWAKDLMRGGKSKLVIRLEKDEFNGPYIQIPFIIRRKRLQLISLLFILFVGLFMLSGNIASITTIFLANYGINIPEWIIGVFGTILSVFPIAWLQIKEIQ